jgi:DNA polymerase-1
LQELRILASECLDPVLMDAYLGEQKKDVHTITAAAIAPIQLARHKEVAGVIEVTPAGVDYDDYLAVLNYNKTDVWLNPDGLDISSKVVRLQTLFKAVRGDAKAVNFLINYLGGASTLSRNLGIKKELAQQFMDQVFARYARISPWQQEMIQVARSQGYVQTAYGDRRHLTEDILSNDGFVRSRQERQAVNFIIQATAARILKIVLRKCHQSRLFQECKAVMIAPVYDELAASVPRAAACEYIARLSEIMTITPPGHTITMLPEVELGPTWGQMIEIGAYPSDDKINEAIARIDAEPQQKVA